MTCSSKYFIYAKSPQRTLHRFGCMVSPNGFVANSKELEGHACDSGHHPALLAQLDRAQDF
jgi:hypothetical protein